jgi:cation transport regulator ChaB
VKTLTKALLSILVGKKPVADLEKALDQRRAATPREELQENIRKVMTPERQALIQEALKVQRAKAKILDDLKDEDKRRLYALAVKKMLHQDDGKPPGKAGK